MAEARADDDEERMREPGGARRSAEHSDRNKPDQRLSSQGPLSSIRAVIKRTSRTSSHSDHQRDRRRPEITILSAEPLPSNTWFPGASGAFPPAPPPAPSTWAATAATVQLPPPSYEQVIREKSREQNIPSSSSSSSSSRLSTCTIATQTDTHTPGPRSSAARPVHKPPKPPRPSLPLKHTSDPDRSNPKPVDAQHEQCGVQTDFDDITGDISPIGPAPTSKFSTQSVLDDISSIGPTPTSKFSTQSVLDDISSIGPTPTSKFSTQSVLDDISSIGPTPTAKFSTQSDLDDIIPIGPAPTTKFSTQSDLDDITGDISPIGPAPNTKFPPLRDLDDIIGDISSIGPTPTADFSTQSDRSDISPIGSAPSAKTYFDFPVEPMKEEARARPRPRPRSTVALRPVVLDQPITREVKVQTLVRLKDDGADSVFAGFDDSPSNISSKYLQDLLDVFGSDETRESKASDVEDEKHTSEPLNRPQPRPRTLKSKPQLAPKPSVFDVFDTTVEQNPSKAPSPPVPAPRPLLNKPRSPSESCSSTKPSAATRPATPSQRRSSEGHAVNTAVKKTPVTPADRNVGKRPSVPKHSRPPPPVLRNMASPSQTAADVSRAADASVPPLPPRPSGGRLLPLRPPPVKVAKPAGSASSPTATNQLPSSRTPKRAPPLPPRPKPGHPLYKRYSSTVPQAETEEENISKEQEEPSEETSSHEEEQLIVLDDTDILETQSNTLCASEVKGQDVTVSGVQLEHTPSEQQIQQNRFVVARFAFEGGEGELTFSEGDVITLVEYANEEWGRGILNRQMGIFPLSFIQPTEESDVSPGKPVRESPGGRSRGRALYEFRPECEDELCLKAGDLVCDLEEIDAEWFVGESGGKRGIVPKNYIQVLLDP
ncbi:SH3 domain-containing protein 19 isoform X2 [Pimephales promelas]|uniref:SH3 domain-containing protein 19 isoform X2 n=1 Tax=Pimephales promelas TaxID=90988 RepID=UPI0019559B8B|nr:SH3 domain-containing protein 19 isoform X2 [Pimephales promelas]